MHTWSCARGVTHAEKPVGSPESAVMSGEFRNGVGSGKCRNGGGSG